MNTTLRIGLAAVLALAIGAAVAQATDDHTVTFTVQVADEVAVDVDVELTLLTPDAGDVFAEATNDSSRLAFTTNNATARKITVSLDAAMPTGMRLGLAASDGGRTVDNLTFTGGTEPTLADLTVLTVAGQDLVTNFANVAFTGIVLTYTLEASLAAAPQLETVRVVTFTILAN